MVLQMGVNKSKKIRLKPEHCVNVFKVVINQDVFVSRKHAKNHNFVFYNFTSNTMTYISEHFV